MPDSRQLFATFIKQATPMPDRDIDEIVDQFEELSLNKGDHFLKAGSYANHYLFLASGFLRAYSHNQEGEEVSTSFHNGPCVAFEVFSFFNRSISKENILALTDCEGLAINFEKLNHLFHNLPGFRDFGRAMLVRGFSLLKQRMLSQITETAEERYARLIQANPEIFQHAPLKDIASYLGITDTSLSRIRRNFIQK